jgi:hypothetical protein
MKSVGKNLLPQFLFNSINRDLLIVISTGFAIAVAIVTLMVMIISQF